MGFTLDSRNMFFTTIKPLVEKFIQECERGETPGHCFTCFIEMYNYLKLVSFIKREKLLVPNMMSILPIKIVSKAMVLAILNFLENLLNFDHGNHENQDNIMLHGFF